MFTDLPEEQLRGYRSTVPEPEGFDAFWRGSIAVARERAVAPRLTEVDTGLTAIRTWDVEFSGWNGQPIRAWLRAPAHAEGPLPAVVHYVGYGGGRGSALDELAYSAAGYAHLLMDTRGQGSGWSEGATPDDFGTGPQAPGVMTRGIGSIETYYYGRFFTDAVMAVDAARSLDLVDGERIAVHGGSQGGAAALAAGALADDVRAVVARVPFLCDIPRAITITDAKPFHEIVEYLAVHRGEIASVLHVLSHIDGVHFASRITAPLLVTAALMDAVVPPSGPFAAFNASPSSAKDLLLHPYNGHEGGGPEDTAAALAFLARHLGSEGTRA
ncbi:acetylxylan esterase [Amnibacterium endophyticum]|uniref:Acetylxylan esterase n=1 Tax=Amnibacterium endophyticum TaxID=2109337 RepID=A0ABW4LFE2_9MICO